MNPALRKSITPPHQVITVMLPVNKKQVFEQHLKAANKAVSTKKIAHHAVKNKKHTHLAAKHHHTATKHVVARTHTTTHTAHNYVVRRGDNLRELAAHHHTTIKHLMAINHLSHSALQIGEHLKV